ncbi:MAG TPA: carboxypeptidase-like regulatory domain-containing protein, partial [Acidobacteriaceae bacterium]
MVIRKFLAVVSLLFLSLPLAYAQGTTSRISGVATDTSGAVVANAAITATNDDTGVSYATKTSASGTY